MCKQLEHDQESPPALAPPILEESTSSGSSQGLQRRRVSQHKTLHLNAVVDIIPRRSLPKKTKVIFRFSQEESHFAPKRQLRRRRGTRGEFSMVGGTKLNVVCLLALSFAALAILALSSGSSFPSLRGLRLADQHSDFSAKPQTVGFVYSSHDASASSSRPTTLSVVRIDSDSRIALQQTNYNLERSQLKEKTNFPVVQWDRKQRLVERLSKHSNNPAGYYPTKEDPGCELRAWQKKSFPTCNSVHEQGLRDQVTSPRRQSDKFFLGTGSWRQVWLLEPTAAQAHEQVVMKSMRLDQDWDWDSLDRHRQDALISERLTASPWFVDIYGACGNSALYELASGGSLRDAIGAVENYSGVDTEEDHKAQQDYATWSSSKKMNVAFQTVSALADLHTIDDNIHPSVCHDDLDISQFVSVNGVSSYKLSDFNGAKLIPWNRVKQQSCPFDANMVGGKFRSPEEYKDDVKVTHKIDNFALGNVLYTILTGRYPYDRSDYDMATKKVIHGIKPHIPDKYSDSSDPKVQALIEAMHDCWHREPTKRLSAQELKRKLEPFVVQQNKS